MPLTDTELDDLRHAIDEGFAFTSEMPTIYLVLKNLKNMEDAVVLEIIRRYKNSKEIDRVRALEEIQKQILILQSQADSLK